ncbi:hypothetical protein PRIPAC_89093 [Pristionchus pacificus]|uniref:Uncharacterized protein n=1 Tax=Pristionchus pacificus TaxID=54126 RepID=A0A2A6BZ36_PRIPA|nr:hypothetical protein PRIPAC_89093 [Pristionchus pacificus]|eukprot:PDM71204.1 hypothetical protein PRIPAC_43587 [Pristionchus pacificus]
MYTFLISFLIVFSINIEVNSREIRMPRPSELQSMMTELASNGSPNLLEAYTQDVPRKALYARKFWRRR